MRWLVLALLLIATPAQAQTVLWFSGAETGDLLEANTANTTVDTTHVHSGAYAIKGIQNQSYQFNQAVGTGASTTYVRFWFRWDSINAPGNAMVAMNNNSSTKAMVLCFNITSNVISWQFNTPGPNCGNGTIASGTTVLSSATYYLIEAKFVNDVSVGGVEAKVNGNTEFSSFGTNTTATGIQDNIFFGPFFSGVGATFYFDDMMICTGAYCPHGITIARQGTSGSPTYTAWTKNSCTSSLIENCWSDTPFSATTPSASSTVLNDAQTMLVHDFGTTQSGHGTETMGNASTINACKTYMVANAASGGTLTMRRRLLSVDTDTAKTITTSNAYYDDGIWTTTAGVLRNSSVMEIGAKQGANTVTQTVRDMGLICDFATATQAPKHRVIQQ